MYLSARSIGQPVNHSHAKKSTCAMCRGPVGQGHFTLRGKPLHKSCAKAILLARVANRQRSVEAY